MNWLPSGKATKFEKLNEYRGSLKKDFKVKDKAEDDDSFEKEITKVDHGLITHLERRKGNPKLESEGTPPSQEAIEAAENEAKELYEKALKIGENGDSSVKENADKLTGWGSRFMDGLRKGTALMLKATTVAALTGIPVLGDYLAGAHVLKTAFPETLQAKDNPSLIETICDKIDDVIIDKDKAEVAHKVVAKAFTAENGEKNPSVNKVEIEKALKSDQAAILGVEASHHIMTALDQAAEKADKIKADEVKPKGESFEAKVRAKMQQDDNQNDAEDAATDTLKERRLLVVRAMTENTALTKMFKENEEKFKDFFDLEPTQMQQVLEAFHRKGFNPTGDHKKYELVENDKQIAKFDAVIKLVKTNKEEKTLEDILKDMPSGTQEEKDERAKVEKDFKADLVKGNNLLGHKLWEHETSGALRVVGMAGRKMWQSTKTVRDILFKWSPQTKTIAAVAAMAAGHAAVGHFKPKKP